MVQFEVSVPVKVMLLPVVGENVREDVGQAFDPARARTGKSGGGAAQRRKRYGGNSASRYSAKNAGDLAGGHIALQGIGDGRRRRRCARRCGIGDDVSGKVACAGEGGEFQGFSRSGGCGSVKEKGETSRIDRAVSGGRIDAGGSDGHLPVPDNRVRTAGAGRVDRNGGTAATEGHRSDQDETCDGQKPCDFAQYFHFPPPTDRLSPS